MGMAGLALSEITRLINRYIGVSGGYLADFTYRTHADFYAECDLDFDPNQIDGTTRQRFQTIISGASPQDQAKIVRGILAKYPPNPDALATRTQELHDEFEKIAARLEGASPVGTPRPAISKAVVERAIADAEKLLTSTGATSGVDRMHTALHGYLQAVCEDAGITHTKDDAMNRLLKLIREQHPAFETPGPRSQDVDKVLKSMGTIMDALNPVRNNASVAHPNADLLDAPEAMLVINATRTILHYLDAKIST